MPLNKAIEMLKSDYHEYINYLKSSAEFVENSNQTLIDEIIDEENNEKHTNSQNQTSNENLKPKPNENSKPKPSFRQYLDRIANLEAIKLSDIDFLISYLNKKKEDHMNAMGNRFEIKKSNKPKSMNSTQ